MPPSSGKFSAPAATSTIGAGNRSCACADPVHDSKPASQPARHAISPQGFMSAIKSVSGTAFVVAEFRAEENREPRPLYVDPVVRLFLDDDSRDAARRVSDRFPQARDLVRTRTKY